MTILIMLMIKSHKRTPPNNQVAFIGLKLGSFNTFVQLRDFGESVF